MSPSNEIVAYLIAVLVALGVSCASEESDNSRRQASIASAARSTTVLNTSDKATGIDSPATGADSPTTGADSPTTGGDAPATGGGSEPTLQFFFDRVAAFTEDLAVLRQLEENELAQQSDNSSSSGQFSFFNPRNETLANAFQDFRDKHHDVYYGCVLPEAREIPLFQEHVDQLPTVLPAEFWLACDYHNTANFENGHPLSGEMQSLRLAEQKYRLGNVMFGCAMPPEAVAVCQPRVNVDPNEPLDRYFGNWIRQPVD